MAGPAQEQAGCQHPDQEERKDLFRKPPGGIHPLGELVLLEPADQHAGHGHEKEGGDDPLRVIDVGPDSAFRLRGSPVQEDQGRDHGEEVQAVLPEGTRHVFVLTHGDLPTIRTGQFFLEEEEMHEKPDDHAEQDSTHGAGNSHLRTQDAGRKNDGQDIDGRARVEEGDRRSEACPARVDAREKRKHRTGADGQDRARHRGHTVGQHLVRACSEVFEDRGLRHEHADGSRDEEGRNQTKKHVLPGIPANQGQGLEDRSLKARPLDRQKVGCEEGEQDVDEFTSFAHV